MNHFLRLLGLVKRLLSGENVFIAKRTKPQWDAQYKQGKWNRLVEDIPPNTKSLVEMIGAVPLSARVLDIGCGNGGLYFALKQKGMLVEYVGVDYSVEAITQAKAKFPEAVFFVGDATLPKEEWGRGFNIIVFNEVLYYVSVKDALSKCAKLLAPHGRVLASMYVSWRTCALSLFMRIFMGFSLGQNIPSERGYPSFLVLSK